MGGGRVYKVEAIILKRKNTGEADRILTLFSREYGKLRAIGKGIRKTASRRAPHLEIFTRVSAVFHEGRSLDHISEVSAIDTYPGLRSDIAKVSLAYYIAEIIDALLAEKQEQPDVYDLAVSAFSDLEQCEPSHIYKIAHTFTLELLWALGFLPRTKVLRGTELQLFIESITERRLKSTDFAKLFVSTQPGRKTSDA